MKYKTSELEGADLDLAVAKAEGAAIEHVNVGEGWMVVIPGKSGRIVGLSPELKMSYAPSVVWDQGGPIIERERISVVACHVRGQDGFFASTDKYEWCIDEDMYVTGKTPLIAAMRAYVASKFGEEVELP